MRAILRQFRAQERVVQILLINDLTIFLSFAMLYPYLAVHFTRDLGFAAWMVGLILGVRTLSQQGLTVIGDTLADRLGYRPVIVGGLALRAIGFALFGLTDTFVGIMTAAILTGFAGALFNPALRSYLASKTPGQRAEIFALDNVFGQTGNLVGPLLGVALLRVSFQLVSLCAAALFLLLMIVQIIYLPEPDRSTRTVSASVWQDWGEVFANRPFLLFSLAMIGYLILTNQLYLGLPLEVQRLTGSQTLVGVIYILPSLIMIGGQVAVTAFCRQRWRNPQSIAIGVGVLGLAFVPLLLAAPVLPVGGNSQPGFKALALVALNLSPVLIAIVLIALGQMMAQPFTMELIPILSRERLLGTYFGFYSVAAALGVTIGNTLTGAAFDAGGKGGLTGLPWLLAVILGLGSALAVRALDRRGRLVAAATIG